jgi:hypothetical protein
LTGKPIFLPGFLTSLSGSGTGISARRRSILLRGLNNVVPVFLRLAFGEKFIFEMIGLSKPSVFDQECPVIN